MEMSYISHSIATNGIPTRKKSHNIWVLKRIFSKRKIPSLPRNES